MRALLPLLVLLSASCGAEREGIAVCAAASLREVVAEACGGAPGVRLRFDASDRLARQIAEGAPCDLFLSADPRAADALRPLDRFPWLGNRLVFVRRKGDSLSDPAAAGSLALGSEGSPAGRYAAAALRALGIAPPASPIRGAHVRDVLSKVAEGAAEAGVVYATDVAVDPRVEVFFVPPDSAQPAIVYEAALLHERARPLFESLKGTDALAAATRRGFTLPR